MSRFTTAGSNCYKGVAPISQLKVIAPKTACLTLRRSATPRISFLQKMIKAEQKNQSLLRDLKKENEATKFDALVKEARERQKEFEKREKDAEQPGEF